MYVKVTVTPGAKREHLVQKNDRDFLISVREPAEQNRANTAVRKALAGYLKIDLNRIRIISGHHSPKKMLSVDVEDTVQ